VKGTPHLKPLTLAGALLAALTLSSVAHATPVPADQHVGVDLRRTTLVVKDVDASLKVYRDALGLVTTYDHIIRTPPSATTDAAADKSRRLVLLRANDDYVGVIGLLQYFKPAVSPRPTKSDILSPGDMVMVFNTKDLKAKFERIKLAPGVRIGEAPRPVAYPSYDGKGLIHVMFSSFYDPDGNYVELNEVLDGGLK
jgi:catechol 2,3-dioxygenase-like lactoylglutathione lyase family enzyme